MNSEYAVCEEFLDIPIVDRNGTLSSRRFVLKTIVNHHGTLSNGHYTAIVKDKARDRWCIVMIAMLFFAGNRH